MANPMFTRSNAFVSSRQHGLAERVNALAAPWRVMVVGVFLALPACASYEGAEDAVASATEEIVYPPTVLGVLPSEIPQGSTSFTISGTGFVPGAVAYIDGIALPTTFTSSTRLDANPSAIAAGYRSLIVRNAAGADSPVYGVTIKATCVPQPLSVACVQNGVVLSGYRWNGCTYTNCALYQPPVTTTPPARVCPQAGLVANWETNPGSATSRRTYQCPAMGGTIGRVWGTSPFTKDSAVCPAALFSGRIPASGGYVEVTIGGSQTGFGGGYSNGIQALSYAGSYATFTITDSCY